MKYFPNPRQNTKLFWSVKNVQFQCSDLFVQFVVIWNIVSASTKMSFVNLYDVDELGNFVLIGCVNVNLRKECPNCYVMFVKSENRHCLHRKNGYVRQYYKCPCCGCRIKAYDEF